MISKIQFEKIMYELQLKDKELFEEVKNLYVECEQRNSSTKEYCMELAIDKIKRRQLNNENPFTRDYFREKTTECVQRVSFMYSSERLAEKVCKENI